MIQYTSLMYIYKLGLGVILRVNQQMTSVIGLWKLVYENWSMKIGLWKLVYENWSMKIGQSGKLGMIIKLLIECTDVITSRSILL